MKVLVTAPMPGRRTPSLPLAGWMRLSCLFIVVDSPEVQHDYEIEGAADRRGPEELVHHVHEGQDDEKVDEVALGERVLDAGQLGLEAAARGLLDDSRLGADRAVAAA